MISSKMMDLKQNRPLTTCKCKMRLQQKEHLVITHIRQLILTSNNLLKFHTNVKK